MEKCQASQGSEGLRWRADGDAFPGGVTDSCAGRVPRGQSCDTCSEVSGSSDLSSKLVKNFLK